MIDDLDCSHFFVRGLRAAEAQSVFDALRTLVPKLCEPASPLRGCFSVNKETCDNRVSSSFESCLRDQRIKFAGVTSFDPAKAATVEEGLKKCVFQNYAMLSSSSYRPSVLCDREVPKVKPKETAKKDKEKPKRSEETAFEDPFGFSTGHRGALQTSYSA